MKRLVRFRFPSRTMAALLLFPLAPIVCRADMLLPIDIGVPNIQGFNGTLSYDATTGIFHSDILPLIFVAPNLPNNPNGFVFFDFFPPAPTPTLSIDLVVNPDGTFNSNGAGISVTGALDLDGDGTDDVAGTLLTGNIIAFGSDPPGPPTVSFNGLFLITGGLLTQDVPLSGGGTYPAPFSVGALGGFLLNAEDVPSTGTLGDFSSSFADDSVKATVGLATPEPVSAILALIGVACAGATLGWRRKRPVPA
jgi:hypothetical protein